MQEILRKKNYSENPARIASVTYPILLDLLGERLEFISALEVVANRFGPRLCTSKSEIQWQVEIRNISLILESTYNRDCVNAAIAFAEGLTGFSRRASETQTRTLKESTLIDSELSKNSSTLRDSGIKEFRDDRKDNESVVSAAWIVIFLILGGTAAFFATFYQTQRIEIWRNLQADSVKPRGNESRDSKTLRIWGGRIDNISARYPCGLLDSYDRVRELSNTGWNVVSSKTVKYLTKQNNVDIECIGIEVTMTEQ